MFDSAYQKILRITGRGRDSSNNNKESEDEHDSVEEYICALFSSTSTVNQQLFPYLGRLVEKDEYLIRNGAYLFKELVKSTHGKINPFRIFSLKELQKATNNFSADLILNVSHFHTYRGIIEDKHVSVKIPGILRTLVHDVVSLSLIKHRNVVKLLGCCLETENLIVVHELPPNGTLRQYILDEKPPPVELLWTDRLRIATEIADALAYLHSELHMTHGRLRFAEAILLDEFHSAKLGAFDRSKIQNQAESSDVKMDIRNKFIKRADVSDFGGILLNLLGIDNGEFEQCYDKVQILNYLKLKVSKKERPQIKAFIDLLLRCRPICTFEQLRNIFIVNQQPSMKEVAREDELSMDEVVQEDELSMDEVVRELRRIRRMINHQPIDGNKSYNLWSGANNSSSMLTSFVPLDEFALWCGVSISSISMLTPE